VLDGVPLVVRDRDGWFAPHALWRSAPELALAEDERLVVRRRAAEDLVERGRFDEAVTLLHEVGLWDSLGAALRRACLATDRLMASQLARWLALGNDEVRRSPAGQLASGIHAAFTQPATAVAPLTAAAAACRTAGDDDGEVTALAQLARLAWFGQDEKAVEELKDRVGALEATGSPKARGMAALRRALAADLRGDDEGVLTDLGTIEPGVLDPAWEIMVSYLAGSVHFERGDYARANEIVDRLGPTPHPALTPFVDYLRGRSWWGRGQFDRVLRQAPLAVAQAERSGVAYLSYLAHLLAVQTYAHIGETARARRHIDAALALAPPPRAGRLSVHSAVMLASVQLAEGDEPAATATLREAVEVHGFDQPAERRAWRQTVSLTYVLLPETRVHWDDLARHGQRSTVTAASALVVAARSGDGGAVLRWPGPVEPVRLRAALYFRFATEVAVALAAAGRPQGTALLDLLGPAGRAAARDLAGSGPGSGPGRRTAAAPAPAGAADAPPARRRLAQQARSVLASVPAAPARSTSLAVLGPLVVTRIGPDGHRDDETRPRLRRRAQEVLAFLVAHRRTTRAALETALWPELDARSAANNLSVTLNHLRRALEPERDPREPSYLLRLNGPGVALFTDHGLRIDVDEFNEHLRAAARAEIDGAPSVALDHDLAAVELYRGDLHSELAEVDWLALDREHYRAGLVAAAVRAGELLLGRGEPDHADAVARRALEVDGWSEGAYGVLVNAALTRGDRATAQRHLDRCAKAVAALGLSPSASIEQLQRRIHDT
jgi:DNA-binding SARP family transcriptional activator